MLGEAILKGVVQRVELVAARFLTIFDAASNLQRTGGEVEQAASDVRGYHVHVLVGLLERCPVAALHIFPRLIRDIVHAVEVDRHTIVEAGIGFGADRLGRITVAVEIEYVRDGPQRLEEVRGNVQPKLTAIKVGTTVGVVEVVGPVLVDVAFRTGHHPELLPLDLGPAIAEFDHSFCVRDVPQAVTVFVRREIEHGLGKERVLHDRHRAVGRVHQPGFDLLALRDADTEVERRDVGMERVRAGGIDPPITQV